MIDLFKKFSFFAKAPSFLCFTKHFAITFLLGAILLLQACETKESNKTVKQTVKKVSGTENMIEQYYENSEPKVLRLRASIDNNKKYNGVYEEYFQSGKIRIKTNFKDNEKHGRYTKYYEDGNIEQLEVFKNGKNDSISTYYYPNGQVEKIKSYKNGIESGAYRAYNKDGQLLQEYNYVDGEKSGVQKVFHKNGKLKLISYYKNGMPGVGLKSYDSNGKEEDLGYRMILKEENTIRLNDTYTFKVSLNKKEHPVKLYFGDLEEGKYLTNQLNELFYDKSCDCYMKKFYIPPQYNLMEPIAFTAVISISDTKKLILTKKINLALTNY